MQSMVLQSPKWVHRRIHVIDSTEAGRLRLINSLDLTPSSRTAIFGSKGMVIVPIAIIPKRVLSAWWVTDASGVPLAVVSRWQSTKLVRLMLASTLKTVGLADDDQLRDAEQLFGFVDNSEALMPVSPRPLFDRFPALADEEPAHRVVRDLINLLSNSWVAMVEIPAEQLDRRIILKYGYDLTPKQRKVDILGLNASFSIDVDDAGFSHSLHHEVHVAPELTILQASLEHQVADGGKTRIIATPAQPGTITHIQNVKFIPRLGTATLEFQCQPQPGGIRAFTGWALILMGLLVILSMVMWAGPLETILLAHWRESTSATVILAVPALLLSWLARSPEAPLVALALLRLRIVNFLLAMTLLSMAASISVAWTPDWWRLVWAATYLLYFTAVAFWLVERGVSVPKTYAVQGSGDSPESGVVSGSTDERGA